MKFAYSLKQKTKIAILLFMIMVCIILIRLLEDRSIKNMETAFTSLYNDRLVPATDLFYIAEKIYAKRYLLEGYVYNERNHLNANQLRLKLNDYNNDIDTLLAKYEKTFLVGNERNHLDELKYKIKINKTLEKSILSNPTPTDKTGIRILYNSEMEASFLDISDRLSQLTRVQTTVGEQLKDESQKIVKGTSLYSTLQLLIAIVIGALIVSILAASNVMNIRNDNYNLN
ncbi:MCP four helix bundle domain-containing protein [Pedobacter sp.]